jgi:hypothetical protein
MLFQKKASGRERLGNTFIGKPMIEGRVARVAVMQLLVAGVLLRRQLQSG